MTLLTIIALLASIKGGAWVIKIGAQGTHALLVWLMANIDHLNEAKWLVKVKAVLPIIVQVASFVERTCILLIVALKLVLNFIYCPYLLVGLIFIFVGLKLLKPKLGRRVYNYLEIIESLIVGDLTSLDYPRKNIPTVFHVLRQFLK